MRRALLLAGLFASAVLPGIPLASELAPRLLEGRAGGDKPVLDSNTIRFLTSGDFPPFNFLDPTGRLTGFNVELSEAICDVLGASCTIQMRPFEDLVPALTQRRGDAIIAGLDGGGLAAQVDMSVAYLGLPGRFMAAKGRSLLPTPEGLSGRWVSAVSGSAHEAFLLDNFPQTKIAAYPDEMAARNAVRDGAVDAHFGDAVSLSFWLAGEASRGCCAFVGGPFLEQAYFGQGLRVGVARGNKKLRRACDWALERLSQNGKLAELYLRWFPNGYY